MSLTRWRILPLAVVFCLVRLTLAWGQANLENPRDGSFQSGIGVISGWICAAERVHIVVDDKITVQAPYGSLRGDTRTVCGDEDNGFGYLVNWSDLGDGQHTVKVLANGVEFARATVTVTTLGVSFLREASGSFPLAGFPEAGKTATIIWQESLQNFTLTNGEPASSGGGNLSNSARLENPQPGSFQSGIGVISGWICAAERVHIVVDDKITVQAPYGSLRGDTRTVCGDEDNGFGYLVNWNDLQDGKHTVRLLADGVEVASATLTITTLGVSFLRGVSSHFVLENFPRSGANVGVRWEESLQNFVVDSIRDFFPAGVASGEITESSVILWTRLDEENEVNVEVARDSAFQEQVRTETVQTRAESDFTAKVAFASLTPGSRYFYRWRRGTTTSEVGTFRTAPQPLDATSLRFAFSGDSDGSKVGGAPFYNDFEALDHARLDGLDFFVYLGDLVYSDFRGGGRPAAQSLADFRKLYTENRAIAALRNLLKATGMYAIWDDHEVREDWDGQTVDPTLFAIARQAFFEYTPLLDSTLPHDPACAGPPLFRIFHWGKDVEVIILDERSCRSPDVELVCSSTPGSPDLAPTLPSSFRSQAGLPATPPPGCLDALTNPARTLLGSVQKQLFKDALLRSTAKFKFVINGEPIQQLFVLPYDRWEGYAAERTEILNFIRTNDLTNVIFLTTDLHANLINEVVVDHFSDATPIADEFVTGPIATQTLQEAILARGGAQLLDALHALLDLVGIDCRHLDAYSYGTVEVNANAGTATITLKDDTGAVITDALNANVRCVKTVGQ